MYEIPLSAGTSKELTTSFSSVFSQFICLRCNSIHFLGVRASSRPSSSCRLCRKDSWFSGAAARPLHSCLFSETLPLREVVSSAFIFLASLISFVFHSSLSLLEVRALQSVSPQEELGEERISWVLCSVSARMSCSLTFLQGLIASGPDELFLTGSSVLAETSPSPSCCSEMLPISWCSRRW